MPEYSDFSTMLVQLQGHPFQEARDGLCMCEGGGFEVGEVISKPIRSRKPETAYVCERDGFKVSEVGEGLASM